MKSPPTVTLEDCDDIFGPSRTYPTGYCPPKNRPSMISAKYRQKEERRKVLKISINKLKKIEDPEASLCRSVLINNTMKRLQQEARDEKILKQQLNYPRCYDNDNYLNLKSEFMKNESRTGSDSFDDSDNQTVGVEFSCDEKLSPSESFVLENDFDAKLAEEIDQANAKNIEVLGNLVEENLVSYQQGNLVTDSKDTNGRFSSRKRSFDDMDDCDVQEVLSQFYMPPTPRMLTCIDDDEDVNVVDDEEPASKKSRSDVPSLQSEENKDSNVQYGKILTDFAANNYLKSNNPQISEPARLRFLNSQNVETDSNSNSYSCGHASMFSELQTNVYHNLIASLET